MCTCSLDPALLLHGPIKKCFFVLQTLPQHKILYTNIYIYKLLPIRYEASVRDQKTQSDKLKRDYNSLVERALKLQQELDEQGRANTQLQSDISLKTLEVKAKEASWRGGVYHASV